MMTKFGSSPSDAGSVLVVPAADIGVEDLAAATEDMTVMARIFQSKLGQARSSGVVLPDFAGLYGNVFLGPSDRGAQSIYLQGFGALFTMRVDFPLAPGPDEPEETPQEQPKTDVDPVWVQAQQEIFDPGASERENDSGKEVIKYNAEQVEDLKTSLVTALKHAANIRVLAPAEVVVVTVTGAPVPTTITQIETLRGSNDVLVVEKSGATKVYRGGLPAGLGTSAATVLTIRAKVADISAYAKGDSSLEQFRQKVQIISHPQLGAGAGRGVTTSISTGYRR
ncbi:MAG: hypothetical protein JW993_16300 [Sedimentisphaerales bacterium]|nr:hypothetical protein [Sedimentisphaerales bacterium]